MKLKDSIKTIVDLKGTSIFTNVLVLNILNDYNSFNEMPSAKNVMKHVISEGYMEKILFSHENQLDIHSSCQKHLHELYDKFGFRLDTATYVINSILEGLGYDALNVSIKQEETIAQQTSSTIEPSNPITQNKTGQHLLFRDVEINGTVNDICSLLFQLGYSAPIPLDGGSVVIQGDFAGVANCDLLIVRARHEDFVWKIVVLMPENNNWYSLKSDYIRFKEMFTKKYGKPESYEYFSEPYEEGDGYEHTALSVGKCSYISFFNVPLGTISVTISERGAITIGYEDKINAERNSNDIDNIATNEI